MSKSTYLVVGMGGACGSQGGKLGAENSTHTISKALARSGERVIAIANTKDEALAGAGVEFWTFDGELASSPVMAKVQEIGSYHLVSDSISSQPQLASAPNCLSTVIVTANPTATQALRVLMQNRPTAESHPGGDTVLMNRTAEAVRSLGYDVTVDLSGAEDAANFDLVHIFNFATPEISKAFAERAINAGTPFVVTTLCEDVAQFHNRSIAWANLMVEYVKRGNDSNWFNAQVAQLGSIQASGSFDNSWTAERAASLIANGQAEANLLQKIHPTAKISTIPVGFDAPKDVGPELFVNQYGVKEFVLCVGRLESRKNQLTLLKALENCDLPIVLVAGGVCYQPEYDRAVRSFKRRAKTLVLDRLSPEMLASAYAASKIHALVSWYELPGLVSLEAAWHGKNVVATDCGTTRDYLADYAFYCQPDNPSSVLNACMAAFYSPVNPDFKNSIEQFTWERAGKETAALYSRCSKSARINKAAQPISSIAVAEPNKPTLTLTQNNSTLASALKITSPLLESPKGWNGAINASALSAPVVSEMPKLSIEEIIEESERDADQGQYNRAIANLEQAISQGASSARVLRSLGAILLANGEAAKSEQRFKESLKMDPNDARSWVGLGLSEMGRGDYKAANRSLAQAIKLDPVQIVALRALVECAYNTQEFQTLEEALLGYVSRNPSDDEMRFCLAGCLYKRGKYNESNSLNREILARSPGHQGALELNSLLERELSTQSWGSVPKQSPIQTLGARVEVQYDNNDQQLSELEENKRRGQFDTVIGGVTELLQTANLSASQREQANLLRAEALVLTGKLSEAKGIFQESLKNNARSARAVCGLAALEAHSGRWSDAKDLFHRALAMKPEYDVPLAGLGLCAIQENNLDKSWEYFWQATQVNPENTRALVGLLEVGYQQKRYFELEGAIRAYLEMHPADVEFVYSLAGCLFAQGKYSEARSEAERIFLFDPQHQDAHELIGMIDRREGVQSANF